MELDGSMGLQGERRQTPMMIGGDKTPYMTRVDAL